jgi:hypothetical protein
MKLKCPKCNDEVKLASENIAQCFFCGISFLINEKKNKIPKEKINIEVKDNKVKDNKVKDNKVKDNKVKDNKVKDNKPKKINIDIKPKDINWRKMSDEFFRKFPEAELLVFTEITTRTTMARYINDRDIDETSKERVLYWAFLNQPT